MATLPSSGKPLVLQPGALDAANRVLQTFDELQSHFLRYEAAACCIARFAADAPARCCKHSHDAAWQNWFLFEFMCADHRWPVSHTRAFAFAVRSLNDITDERLIDYSTLAPGGFCVGALRGTSAVATALRLVRRVGADVLHRRARHLWIDRISRTSIHQAFAVACIMYPAEDRALLREHVVAEMAKLFSSVRQPEATLTPSKRPNQRKARAKRPEFVALLAAVHALDHFPEEYLRRKPMLEHMGEQLGVSPRTVRRCIDESRAQAKADKSSAAVALIELFDGVEAKARRPRAAPASAVSLDDEHDRTERLTMHDRD